MTVLKCVAPRIHSLGLYTLLGIIKGTVLNNLTMSTVPEVLLQVRSQAALWVLALGLGNPVDAASVTCVLQGWGTELICVDILVVPVPISNNVYIWMSSNKCDSSMYIHNKWYNCDTPNNSNILNSFHTNMILIKNTACSRPSYCKSFTEYEISLLLATYRVKLCLTHILTQMATDIYSK